ncbi:MAG: 2,3-bisphosphoglycerate-independent phosphoglycerate mutase, partial [Pseudoxanthomonas sp.]
AIASARFDVIICNIANPDMVGHSGDLQAAILAAQAVDVAIGEVDAAVRAQHGALLITADHGNLEMMRDPDTGQPHTAHTIGPVPLVYVGEAFDRLKENGAVSLRAGGALRDVAPTLLNVLGMPKPAEMTGRSLFHSVG